MVYDCYLLACLTGTERGDKALTIGKCEEAKHERGAQEEGERGLVNIFSPFPPLSRLPRMLATFFAKIHCSRLLSDFNFPSVSSFFSSTKPIE